MLSVGCSMCTSYVICYMLLYDICYQNDAIWSIVIGYMLYVIMLYVIRYRLYVYVIICYMLYVTCCGYMVIWLYGYMVIWLLCYMLHVK